MLVGTVVVFGLASSLLHELFEWAFRGSSKYLSFGNTADVAGCVLLMIAFVLRLYGPEEHGADDDEDVVYAPESLVGVRDSLGFIFEFFQ